MPLEVAYEYAALVLNGDCSLEGQPLQERVLYYWEERRRFGEVTGYPGPRLAAPSLTKLANPNPVS